MTFPERATTFPTALGACALAWSDGGVTRVRLPGDRGMPAAEPIVPERVRAVIDALTALLGGARVDLRWVALDERDLDDFDRRVYEAARTIGPGTTATYGELARAIGDAGAARAVGAALARNPYPIIVPCHRVLAADGALHGFSAPGGVRTKRRMLEIERAPGFAQAPLFE